MKKYLLFLLASLFVACQPQGELTPVSLTCEYRTNPTVVDVASPQLSWINQPVSAEVKGAVQSAYQVLVASSPMLLEEGKADVWDSGKVVSTQSYLVPFQGATLLSGKDYYWKVRVWDGADKPSGWSATAQWGMGLLDKSDWKAQWIGAPWQGEESSQDYGEAPLFRKSFSIGKPIAKAKAFICGLGYFELYANGEKVGDDCLVPNLTNFSNRPALKDYMIVIPENFAGYRVLYLAYDVTSMLQQGENTLGVFLGNGFYNTNAVRFVCPFGSPRLICQLQLTYADGTTETVVSDPSWTVKRSAIVENDIYNGEIYDARKETDNWCSNNCNPEGWEPAVPRKAPLGGLSAHTSPTDKVMERLNPVSLTLQDDGTYAVDFGKEISGWIALRGIQGTTAGDTIDVHYICESRLGEQKYVCKGAAQESYAPRFTWYVFSKAIISGVKTLTPEQLTAEAVNTDVVIDSEFSTSNEMFNQINTIWQRSQMDNMHGCTASDCPHRERAPYTGDGEVACATVMENFDAAAFYHKWMRDMRDSQDKDTGYEPNGAPWFPGCGGGVPWGAAMNIIPWEFYMHYGDLRDLRDNYEAMKSQVRYMGTWETPRGTIEQLRCNDGTDTPQYWLNLGEWGPVAGLPTNELVHTFFWWLCTDITARAAHALGESADEATYRANADKIAKAFHTTFYNSKEHTYGDFGSNVFALRMGVPDDRKADVVETLRKELVETYNSHLNTGIFGTRYLFETLAQHGLNDVAYAIMNQSDYPSYGNWIQQGATVTWEFWDGEGSHNHPMFGGGLVWYYRHLAGLQLDENEPAYRHIIVRPTLVKELTHVDYSKQTPYGKASVSIQHNNADYQLTVVVPVGSHATVYLPGTGKTEEVGQGTHTFSGSLNS